VGISQPQRSQMIILAPRVRKGEQQHRQASSDRL
jgi:hypothetical protein